jgi:methylenetetrahydrofolate reductase (NADPH)
MTAYSLEMTAKDAPALAGAAALIPAGTLVNIAFLGNEDTRMRVAAARAGRTGPVRLVGGHPCHAARR